MKRFTLYALILTSLLASCAQYEAPASQLEPQVPIPLYNSIRWLTFNKNTDSVVIRRLDALGNCVVNGLNVTGQPGNGGIAGKQDGGLTYGLALPTETGRTTATRVGQNWRNVPGLIAQPNTNVILLIVDDFRSFGNPSNGVYAPSPELFTKTELNGVTLTNLQNAGKLSHGGLVLQHAKDVIEGSGLYPTKTTISSGLNAGTTVYTSPPSLLRKTLILKPVDTGLQTTTIIASGIQTNLTLTTSAMVDQKIRLALPQSTAGAGQVIINLSFAFFPCLAYTDYTRWDAKTSGVDETFVEYMEKLASVQTLVSLDTVNELASVIIGATNNTTDPLYTLIQARKFTNVFVAASGNYGFNTSMYPAGWPGVVNVTGSVVKNPAIRSTKLFNKGEIMDIGASFFLEAKRFVPNPSLYPPLKNVYYIGTSFSTPTVSVFSALDAAGIKRCINTSGIKSDLAANTSGLVDSPLVKAVNTLCQ